jgi:diamine N-acetyltransferase
MGDDIEWRNFMISLKAVDQNNWLQVIRLASSEDQKNRIFEQTIASNCLSLAQASVSNNWITKAIYTEDLLIGFAMYGYSDELQGYDLCRLMIDYRFQGKGYGKKALQAVVEEMQKEYGCEEILICFQPDNAPAKSLYEKFGFTDTGKTIKGNVDELIYKLKLSPVQQFSIK